MLARGFQRELPPTIRRILLLQLSLPNKMRHILILRLQYTTNHRRTGLHTRKHRLLSLLPYPHRRHILRTQNIFLRTHLLLKTRTFNQFFDILQINPLPWLQPQHTRHRRHQQITIDFGCSRQGELQAAVVDTSVVVEVVEPLQVDGFEEDHAEGEHVGEFGGEFVGGGIGGDLLEGLELFRGEVDVLVLGAVSR